MHKLTRRSSLPQQQQWLLSWSTITAAFFSVLIAAAAVFRVGQRAVWLFRDFHPNGTVWETVLLILHEGWILLSAVIAVVLSVLILRILISRKAKGCHQLRFLEKLLGWGQLLLVLLSLVLAGVLITFCLHYRLSVQIIGWVGIITALLAVIFLFGWRFHRNMVRVLTETAILVQRGSFPYDEGIRSLLPMQCIVLAAVQLIPLLSALFQASLVNAAAKFVTETIPIIPRSAITSLLGTGLTGIGSMYAVETLQSVLQAALYLLCIPVYHGYRSAHQWALDGKRFRKRLQ